MAKVRNLSDTQQQIAFTEHDFYQRYVETFKTSELGRIKSLLPLREMAISFGLIEANPKSLRVNRGRKSFFTPEGKIALAFLKMYTGLSAPKLMEALNGNIHYQIFCGIRISPENQLTNYKLIDSILLELSKKLKIQEQQKLLADAWKPYMNNLDTVYTDASCYESLMRFPTDVKLLWECVERAYKMMCGISSQLGEHRLRTKYNDIEKANLAYRKQRKHTHKQTRKMIMRLLALLGKMLGEIRRQMRIHPDEELLNDKQLDMLESDPDADLHHLRLLRQRSLRSVHSLGRSPGRSVRGAGVQCDGAHVPFPVWLRCGTAAAQLLCGDDHESHPYIAGRRIDLGAHCPCSDQV